ADPQQGGVAGSRRERRSARFRGVGGAAWDLRTGPAGYRGRSGGRWGNPRAGPLRAILRGRHERPFRMSPSPAPLEPAPEELRRWAEATVDFVVRYHAGLRDRRVAPATTAREIRAALDRALPEVGAGF